MMNKMNPQMEKWCASCFNKSCNGCELKKVYEPPKMKVVNIETKQSLLCASSNENPYWGGCWEESEEGYWKEK